MNTVYQNNLLNSFSIRNIDKSTRFWMVRTKRGYFYDEFKKDKFIALGWNIITQATDLGEEKIKELKEEIQREYRDFRPMGSINKCRNFIYDMKIGDYVVIPNNGSSKVIIAIVGEYFECQDWDSDDEIEVIAKIENHTYEISEIKCPYRKRRHIKILTEVDVNTLSYKLRRAISSYHGISNFDDYAEDILNGVYDCYAYLDDVHISINIKKEEELKPREISTLMYSLTEFFCGLVEEESISTTINLNSPGSVRIKLKNAFEKLKKAKVPFIFIFLAVTGGSGLGFELPGLVGVIREYKTLEIEVETKQVELDLKETELESQKLENTKALLDLMKQADEQGMDPIELMRQLGVLQDLDESLIFETKENEDDNVDAELEE